MSEIDGDKRMQSRCGIIALAFAWIASPFALGQSPAEETVRKLSPPAGFKVALWAAEPMVVNPTAIDADSRGRVWIAEGLNYRFFRNNEFKKSPGCDKIKILADTDDDGKADKVTVFATDIYPVPMGLAVEERWEGGKYKGCRVYTGNSPDLLLLEDTDGDDKADVRRPLLTGFGGYDHDHGVHGMMLGPDGKLYFTHGNGGLDNRDPKLPAGTTFDVTDKSGRRLSLAEQGVTFRCNLDGTKLEALAWRFRNNYECWADSFGHVFVSDNDDDGNRGSRMVWLMAGGDYGYQNPRSRRHWAEELPGIIPKLAGTGNGSPCGILVYEGREFPPNYCGNVLQIDAGTRQINYHPLTRQGGAYRTEYEVFLKGTDPHFRPIDAAVAPDGSLLVADWYDAGVGGHRFTDQSTGRIYRVTPPGSTSNATAAGQSDLATTRGRIAALLSSNKSTSFVGRAAIIAAGEADRAELLEVWKAGLPFERARVLHVLAASLKTGRQDILTALKDRDPRLRELAIRLLADDCTHFATLPKPTAPVRLDAASASALLALDQEPDPGVWRQILLALPHIGEPKMDATPKPAMFLHAAIANWDGADRFYLEALRVGLSAWPAAAKVALANLAETATAEGLAAKDKEVPLPPFFPTATNDAFVHVSEPTTKATAASKLLGLVWVLQDATNLPLLERLLAARSFAGLESAVEDVTAAMPSAAAGQSLLRQFAMEKSESRQLRLLQLIADRVAGPWSALKASKSLEDAIDTALGNPQLRNAGIRLIGAAEMADRTSALLKIVGSPQELPATRAAALEVVSTLKPQLGAKAAMRLLASDVGGFALAETAIDAAGRAPTPESAKMLAAIATDSTRNLAIRSKALRALGRDPAGIEILVGHFKSGNLSTELSGELQFVLHNHGDPSIRALAERELPLPKAPAGRTLAKLTAAVTQKKGSAKRGARVFARDKSDACIRCHRVEGIGSWVGPDLSSIGIKYGKPELLFHLLAPSAAVGYNLDSYVVTRNDGRVLTGLIVEERDNRLVLKTALNERILIPNSEIESRVKQTKSLMPDGLLDSLNDAEIVDLVEYLASLRRESQTIGELTFVGPKNNVHELLRPDSVARAQTIVAGRDGFVALDGLLDDRGVGMLRFTAVSDEPQKLKLAVAGKAVRGLFVGNQPVRLEAPMDAVGEIARVAEVALPVGATTLGIVVQGNSGGVVVTTIAESPLRFAR